MGRHRVAMTEVLRREAEQRGAVLGARHAAQGQANEHSRQQQRPAARAIVAAREAGQPCRPGWLPAMQARLAARLAARCRIDWTIVCCTCHKGPK